MAVNINSTFNLKNRRLPANSMKFQRPQKGTKTAKLFRKKKIKARHIIFMIFFIGSLFWLAQKLYLFLITWDNLNIKTISISCTSREARNYSSFLIKQKHWGNLLLLDIKELQSDLIKLPAIKDVHIRKIFPSTVKVSIVDSIPFAYIQIDGFYKIDEEGNKIIRLFSSPPKDLPLLLDQNNFKHDYYEKISLASELLNGLSKGRQNEILSIDLSHDYKIKVNLKNTKTTILLDSPSINSGLLDYWKIRSGLAKYGDIEYIDLRFKDKIFLKTLTRERGKTFPNLQKGVT